MTETEKNRIMDEAEAGEPETEQAAEAISLEETLGKLEEIVGVLEEGDCSLEKSFALYREGMALLKAGNEKLDRVEKQILEINDEGETHEFHQ